MPQVVPSEAPQLLLLVGGVAAVRLEQPQDLVRIAAVPGLLGQADLRDVRSVLVLDQCLLLDLLDLLAAAKLLLRGEIGLRLVLDELLILGRLGEGQLGIAGMLLRQGLGVPDVLLRGNVSRPSN